MDGNFAHIGFLASIRIQYTGPGFRRRSHVNHGYNWPTTSMENRVMPSENFGVGAILRPEGAQFPVLAVWNFSGAIAIGEFPPGLADGLTEAEEAGLETLCRWVESQMSDLLSALDAVTKSAQWVRFASRVDGNPVGAIQAGGMRYFGMGNWAWDIAEVRLPGDRAIT